MSNDFADKTARALGYAPLPPHPEGKDKDAPDAYDALLSAQAWLTRWAVHVGKCEGGHRCTCGLTAVVIEVETALIKGVEPPLADHMAIKP